MVFTITGPSGSGKDSIVDAILYLVGAKPQEELSSFVRNFLPELKRIHVPANMNDLFVRELISHTTRTPRVGEKSGKDYFFVSTEDFHKLPKIESTVYAGNYYGLSQKVIDENPAENGIVIVDITGKTAIENYVGKKACRSFFLDVTPEEVSSRMYLRGDTAENIEKRILNSKKNDEFSNGHNCDYVIRNDNFVEAVKSVLAKL